VHDRIISADKGGRWCHVIVLNVHAPTESSTDDLEGRGITTCVQ
jgi:hypothetical protein